MWKLLSILVTIIAVVYIAGMFPPVAVGLTALGIVFMFLVFGY